jgi:AcrR family transcriptional regulator
MQALTRKQQAIRERDRRILDVARPVVARGGIGLLSMDAIATELNAAKGTIYNHFRNKEEIVLALAIQAVECRFSLFNRATLMQGSPRQRVAAIGIACEFFVDQFPELFRIEQIVRHDEVWDKTSTQRRDLLRGCETRCMHVVGGVVRDAVAGGDLPWTEDRSVEDLVFGLWSLVYGGLILEATSPSLVDLGIANVRGAIRRNCNAMLDGLGWLPLYDPAEYSRWVEAVSRELAESVRTIKSESAV